MYNIHDTVILQSREHVANMVFDDEDYEDYLKGHYDVAMRETLNNKFLIIDISYDPIGGKLYNIEPTEPDGLCYFLTDGFFLEKVIV